MIILLSGLAGMEEDAFADYLVKEHGYVKLSFADQLRENLSDTFNIDIKYFYDRKLKDVKFDVEEIRSSIKLFIDFAFYLNVEKQPSDMLRNFVIFGKTPRDLLIDYSKHKRNLDESYFVDIVLNKIKNGFQNKNIVITDCMFKNEKKIFKECFDECYLIWIDKKVEKIVDDTQLVKEDADLIVDYTFNEKRIYNLFYFHNLK